MRRKGPSGLVVTMSTAHSRGPLTIMRTLARRRSAAVIRRASPR